MTDQASTDLREEVRARYAEAARAVMDPKPGSSASCCDSSAADACCGTGSAALEQRLRAETSAQLRSGMRYPQRWDPFFKDFMTLADLYHYPTQHFDFHQRQLTLGQPASRATS